MAIRLEISADVRQALQSLSKFSTEIDKAGGVTEAMAQQISSSLNAAVQGFTKFNSVKVTNPLSSISSEVGSSVDSLNTLSSQAKQSIPTWQQLNSLFHGIFAQQFGHGAGMTELAKVFNEIKSGNLSLDGLISRLNLTDAQIEKLSGKAKELGISFSGLSQSEKQVAEVDFAARFEQARAKISASVDQMVNDALGLNEAFGSINGQDFKTLQSAFINAEKPIEQLKAEILTLGDAIGQTTNPIVLQRFGDQLARLQAQLSQKITPTVSFSTAQINTPFVQPKINTEDLQGLKVVIGSDIQSIEKLNAEIAKIKPLLDTALQGGTGDIGALQAKFNDLTTTITGLQSKAFSTAFIDDSTKSVQQLENEITVLREKINTSFDPKEIGVFAQRIEGLEAQLANIKFGGINLDTSKLTLLQSAFVDAVKPIQQLEAEIRALEGAIAEGTNPAQLQVFNTQLLKLQTQLDNTKINGFQSALKGVGSSLTATGAASLRAGDSLKKLPQASNSANLALLNLSRVAQDAPFGFLGIANNLNPLLESFQRLKAESGSTSATLKNLAGSLMGAGGLGLAVGVASSLLVVFGDRLFKASKAEDELGQHAKESRDKVMDLIRVAATDIKFSASFDSAGEVEKVKDLAAAVLDQTKSYRERNNALNELKEVNKGYFGDLTLEADKLRTLNEKVNEYTNALIAQSVVKAFADSIGKVSTELANQELVLNKTKAALDKYNKTPRGDAPTPQTPVVIAFDKDGKLVSGLKAVNKLYLDQFKNVSELNGKLDELKGAMKGAVDESLKFKPLNVTGTEKTGGQKRFDFLFESLPFDAQGKVKPEQRRQLLDAIDKFQKEFTGIIEGAQFTGTADEQIQQARKLDIQIKAGNIRFDGKGITDKIRAEFNKLKDEDIIPKDQLQAISDTVVQQFLRAFDVTSDQFKDFKLPLPSIEGTLADAKIELQRVGKELPKIFAGKDVFGNPVELSLDELFDFTKIAPTDAIKAIQSAVDQIKKKDKSLAEQITEDLRAQGIKVTKAALDFSVAVSQAIQQAAIASFSGLGEAIGTAIAGGNFADVFKDIFASLGGIIKQLGVEMIALSPLITALKAALHSLSPTGLIAAGVGLVALGTIIQKSFSKVQKFSKGGLVPGTGNQDTVPALLTPGELVIPKSKVAEVQKLLQGSTKLQIPTQLFQSIKNLALAGQNFNIPTRRLNTDAIAPLGRAQMALAGTAGQNVNVTVEGIAKGNDIVYQVAKVLRSQNRNFGRGGL